MSKSLSFTDENGNAYPVWEKKSLGEIGSTYSGLSGKTKEDFGVGEHKFITYMNVFSNIVADPLMVQKIRIEAGENQNEVIRGDILFTTSSETPKEVGMASLWDQDANVFLNSFCFGFRIGDSDVLPDYLVTALHSPLGRKKIAFLAQGSTRYNISKTKLMDVKFPFPSLSEQEKIAEFFSALNERIALTTNKVKLLKEQKAGYLQKIFARELVLTDDNGDRYPEWDQKKLDEIFSAFRGKSLSKADLDPTGAYECVLYGQLYSTYGDIISVVRSKTDNSSGVESEYGDILIPASGESAKDIARASALLKEKVQLGGDLNILRPKNVEVTNPVFLALSISYSPTNKQIAGKAQGNSVVHLSWGNMKNLSLDLPSLPEQEKIAEFFSALDEQIELTENKLTLLKEQKKGYLQGIFG